MLLFIKNLYIKISFYTIIYIVLILYKCNAIAHVPTLIADAEGEL